MGVDSLTGLFYTLVRMGESAQSAQALVSGGVAERSKATVLKTVDPHGSVGSNPTPTATDLFQALGRFCGAGVLT